MAKELIIKMDDLLMFSIEGSKFVINSKAEENLVKLLEAKKAIENMIDDVKAGIIDMGLAVDKDFSGIVGSNLRASYKFVGQQYDISDPKKAEAFCDTDTIIRPNKKKIDEYIKKHRKLPSGIVEVPRKKTLVFNLVNNLLED